MTGSDVSGAVRLSLRDRVRALPTGGETRMRVRRLRAILEEAGVHCDDGADLHDVDAIVLGSGRGVEAMFAARLDDEQRLIAEGPLSRADIAELVRHLHQWASQDGARHPVDATAGPDGRAHRDPTAAQKAFVRARDRHHVYGLMAAGATATVREVFDSAVEVGRRTLVALGHDEAEIDRVLAEFVRQDERMVEELAALWRPDLAAEENPAYLAKERAQAAEIEAALRGAVGGDRPAGPGPDGAT